MLHEFNMHIYFKSISDSYTRDHMFFNIVSVVNQSQEMTDDTKIMKAVLMSCMISVTGTGNALVILGFVVDKSLRTPSNYFLLNLAISDFFTGTFTLPLYLKNYILNEGWVLGKSICKIWLIINYTLCQCTIYNIVLISGDRFLAVTRAVKYRAQQKKTRLAFWKMAAVWILAFLIFGPAIIFWEYVVGYSIVPDGECNPEFYYSGHYLFYSSFFDFFAPMMAIAYFNLSIYYNIRCQMKNKFLKNSININISLPRGDISVIDCNHVVSNDLPRLSNQTCKFQLKKNKQNLLELFLSICKSNSTCLMEKRSKTRTMASDSVQNAALAKDKKIAKSLAVLVCTFCICWAPYSFLTIIREVFCEVCIVSPTVDEVTCWFFFFNSSINPFLYPLCHPAFRKALKQLLRLKKK